jgi:hypothetical protein
MRTYILAIVFTLTLNLLVQAQDINGVWMKIPIPNSISYPNINILKINNDSIFAYDFKKLYEKNKVKISENAFYLNDTITVNYSFINDNIFKLNSLNNEEDFNISFRYVRLMPTKDKYHLVDSLENVTYNIHFNNETMIFTLGEKKEKGHEIIIDAPPIAADYTRIEKFGRIYFLCLYALNRLTYAFPIKEIHSNSFVIYGVPGYENDVIAEIFEQD